MNILAEVSDKVVSTGQMWAVGAVVSFAVGAVALGSRSWFAMLIAAPISLLGCTFTLSFLDDPVFGDAVLQENGWSWFVSKLTACALPVATVTVIMGWRRHCRTAAGFSPSE